MRVFLAPQILRPGSLDRRTGKIYKAHMKREAAQALPRSSSRLPDCQARVAAELRTPDPAGEDPWVGKHPQTWPGMVPAAGAGMVWPRLS